MTIKTPSRTTIDVQVAVRSGPNEASRLIEYGYHETPLGRCLIALAEGRICQLSFVSAGSDEQLLEELATHWAGAPLQLNERSTGGVIRSVFAGAASSDSSLQLLVRGTAFQVEVWQALLDIPPGSVRTYKDVAAMVGRPQASRAVGQAIGANSIAWLIPCHRVIRSDGSIGGYRWGLEMKQACLELEKKLEVGS